MKEILWQCCAVSL